MNKKLIELVNDKNKKSHPPEFRVGQTVNVHIRIREGDKERIQVFTGVVIARRGSGIGETFTVRRIVANEGVERIFLLHSPVIVKVEVQRSGKVRRAKLYYLRERVGKSRRLRERRAGQPAVGPAASESSDKGPVKAAGLEDERELAGVQG